MRVKIIPHGVLRQTWPLDYECEAATPSEALTALTVMHKLTPPTGSRFWQVRLMGYDTVPAINSPLQSAELHIVPDFSGGGGVVKIIVGAVLIVAAIFLAPYALGPITAALIGALAGTGISLVLGGVLELLTPSPKTATAAGSTPGSNYLSVPKNTVANNTRIPIGFGRFLVYGQFLSVNIQSDLLTTAADGRRAAMGYTAAPTYIVVTP